MNDLNDEIAVLARRIELMEEQAIEKDREFRAGKEPLIREINKMNHEL